MDVYLDSVDGVSVLGCTDQQCVAGFEEGSFTLELRANEDVFERYSYRVQNTAHEIIQNGLQRNEDLLEFDLYIVLISSDAEGTVSHQTEYKVHLELYRESFTVIVPDGSEETGEGEETGEDEGTEVDPTDPAEGGQGPDNEENNGGGGNSDGSSPDPDNSGSGTNNNGGGNEEGDLCSLPENAEKCNAVDEGNATDLVDDEEIDSANQNIVDSIDENGSTAAGVPEIAKDDSVYGEDDFNRLSRFDIYAWLKSKGKQSIVDDKDEDRQVILKTLESFYSVPRLENINNRGELILQFSSALNRIVYDELIANFLLFDLIPTERRQLRGETQRFESEAEVVDEDVGDEESE